MTGLLAITEIARAGGVRREEMAIAIGRVGVRAAEVRVENVQDVHRGGPAAPGNGGILVKARVAGKCRHRRRCRKLRFLSCRRKKELNLWHGRFA